MVKELLKLIEDLGIEPSEIPVKTCVCPSCGYELQSPMGKPCSTIECPRCGTLMTRKVGESKVVKVVYEPPKFFIVDGEKKELLGINKEDAIRKLKILNPSFEPDKAILLAMDDGEVELEIEPSETSESKKDYYDTMGRILRESSYFDFDPIDEEQGTYMISIGIAGKEIMKVSTKVEENNIVLDKYEVDENGLKAVIEFVENKFKELDKEKGNG